MPDGLELRGQQPLSDGLSALDLVSPDDRMIVLHAWDRALKTGFGNVLVRPAADPLQSVWIRFVDVRHRYDVLLCFMIGYEQAAKGVNPLAAVPPRVAVVRKNEQAVVIAVDEATHRVLGWPDDELIGRRTLDFLHPDDQQRSLMAWVDMLARPAVPGRLRLRHRHRDGHYMWFDVTNHNRLADPDYGCVVAEMVDVSDEMAAHEALRESEQLLRRLTEALPLGVLRLDHDLRVVYDNGRADGVFPVPVGAPLVLADLSTVDLLDRAAVGAAIEAAVRDDADADLECGYRGPRGEPKRCVLNLRSLSSGALICVVDVTEDVRLREEPRRRA
jgi:PAS domain S-box-containing protein